MNIYASASHYMARYAPSKTRFLAYLEKKNASCPEEILAMIGYDESVMLDAWMRTFINTGRPIFDIKIKLLNKKFEREDIEKKIETFFAELHDWGNFRFNIEKIIQNKLQKGKSLRVLQGELSSKFPYFRDEIEELLGHYSDDSGLSKEIEKYSRKYNLADKKELQKFYQALMRKGFRYDAIKNFLNSEE